MPTPEAKALYHVATQDHKAFELLAKAEDISLAMACFHAQQAAEKYIKSTMIAHKITFPFIHNLVELHGICAENHLHIPVAIDRLEELNPFAVKQRYDLPPEVNTDYPSVAAILTELKTWCEGFSN